MWVTYHGASHIQMALTYLLTPWCRVLLEKLASLQLVKKFPAFYGTRRFLTALTSARHLSLSSASLIQSSYPNPTSWRCILILSSHLRLGLPSGLFPSGSIKNTVIIPEEEVIAQYYLEIKVPAFRLFSLAMSDSIRANNTTRLEVCFCGVDLAFNTAD